MELPARTVLVAAGTAPNVTYEKEHPGAFTLDGRGKFFKGYRVDQDAAGVRSLVEDAQGFFTSYARDGRFVSYYGDNHPRYNGNVVKAMASAKHGYPHVVALFDDLATLDPAAQPVRDAAWNALVARSTIELLARVERVERLTPTIIDVVVKAPAAARHFEPGQFYRLQNFERRSARVTADGRDVGARHGGRGADRRLGRSRAGPAVAHHPRDGRVEPPVRVSPARANRWS